jgi:hypothetical protein
MSQEAINAISNRSQLDPATALERQQAQVQPNAFDLSTIAVNTPQGGSSIALKVGAPQASSEMNLKSLASDFAQGLQNGFYAKDMNRLMTKLNQPGAKASVGEIAAEMLQVQNKMGIADAFSRVSSKLAEGLQTMVVKQG